MKPSKLRRRWQTRFRKCTAAICELIPECRRSANAESIHRLRVALRRCRLLAGLASFAIGHERLHPFRQQSGHLLDALGRVRDLDITLAWLHAHDADARAVGAIAQRRKRLWRKTQPLLARVQPREGEHLQDLRIDADGQRRLRKRCVRQIQKSADLLASLADFRDPGVDQSHELRRAVRRWRYLRELLLSRSEQEDDRLLQALLRFQEASGDAQDRVVVAATLTDLHKPRLVRPYLAAVAAERDHLVARAQSLSARMSKLHRCRTA
jgi:CHAD domain-containing protein